MTHAHTRTLTNVHTLRSTAVRDCRKGDKLEALLLLYRGCLAFDGCCGVLCGVPGKTKYEPYYKWNIAQSRPMSVSDVSRSLQS